VCSEVNHCILRFSFKHYTVSTANKMLVLRFGLLLAALLGLWQHSVAQTTHAPTPVPTPVVTAAPTNSTQRVCSRGSAKADMLVIGQPTVVCLVVNSLNWTASTDYSLISIFPRADQFTRMRVNGSWEAPWTDTTTQSDALLSKYGDNIGIHVESAGVISYQKRFRSGPEGRTFSIFTAIINVDRGHVRGITWDDGCHFCAFKTECAGNTFDYTGGNSSLPSGGKDCFFTDAACEIGSKSADSNNTLSDPQASDTNPLRSDVCQLTVYVVWSGTDKNGLKFTSQQKRLSRFAGPSVGKYIKDARSTFSGAVTRVSPNPNNAIPE
jgi:hypothetical protein